MAAHFDIEAALTRIRADQEEVFAQASQLAETDKDRRYVQMQADLAPLTVEFARWDLGWRNKAEEPEMAATALGDSLAGLIWNFSQNVVDAPQDVVIGGVMDRICEILSDRLNGVSIEQSLDIATMVDSVPVGTA